MPYVKSDDTNIYYDIVGKGEPVMFIHGLGSSTEGWKFQTDYFSKFCKVILVDLRGHGKSDKPKGKYSVSLFAQDCLAIIDDLNIQSLHIVGISLGSLVAFEMAVKRQQLVKSLVIVNGIPEVKITKPYILFRIYIRLALTWLLGVKNIGRILSKNLFPGDDKRMLRKQFIEEWSKNDKNAYLKSALSLMNWSAIEQVKNMDIPILLLSAEFDYISIEQKKYYKNKLLRGELVVIENTRHALPAEKPDAFNQEVKKFLKKVGAFG